MPEETYTCDVCGQQFNDADSLSQHMVTNHATKTVEVGEGEEK